MVRSAVEMNAIREHGTIALVNAPGHLLGISLATGRPSRERIPDSLGPFLWRVLSIPLFAVPAWFFVGRGMDGFHLHQRMSLFDFVLSAILVLLSLPFA
jgi:hypothetical protein